MASDDVPTSVTPSAPLQGDGETLIDLKPLVNPAPAKPAFTLYGLGRRISSRTTDLLAIAIVLIASLTMGRQMLQWWHEEPPSVLDMGPLENLGTEWGANSQPVSLEFGDSSISMTRQVLPSGGPQAALDSVRQRCQAILVESNSPGTPRDQAESDQLDALSKLTPETEQPGSWQLYTITGGLPMVVGVKSFDSAAKTSGTEKMPATNPSDGRRVVCWGLVFPGLSPGSWTAYTFVRRPAVSGDSPRTQSQDIELSRLELPAGAQRTLLMQESEQSGLLGFQGAGQTEGWQQHFSTWFQKQGWNQSESWQPLQGGWSGRFVRREPGRMEDSTIQVQCYQQKTGQGVGLIQWFPGRKPQQESPEPAARGTP